MNISITELLGDAKKQRLTQLVAQQETRLADTVCLDQVIGKWVDDFDMPFLADVLSSGDEEFRAEFPNIEFTADERDGLLDTIINHAAECPHCQLRLECNLELNAAISGEPHNYASVGSHA